MLTLLERYVTQKILYAMLGILALAAALAYVVSFLGEFRQIGTGDYGLLQAALYALLELPFNLNQFYPMLTLLAGLTGLGILAAHQELVVMRVSGLSPSRFVGTVLMSGILLALLGLLLGEAIAPRLHYLANMHKTMALSGGQAVVTQSGIWVHEGNDFIHIQQVISHRHLEGVTRFEFAGEHRLQATSHAERLDYQDKHWVASQLVRTVFTNSGETVHEEQTSTPWQVQLNPVILNAGLIEPEQIPLSQLLRYTRRLEHSGMQVADFQFSFSRRVFRPLAIIVMLLLAIPFVFVPPRTLSPGLRLFLGVLAGFTFYILNTLLGQLSVIFQLSPWLTAFAPILMFAALDAWLIRRTFRQGFC